MTEFALPVEGVILTNRSLTDVVHVVLDRGKLEGALARPMHTFGGELLFPTLMQRGAALLDGLVNAHAFQDGNKRTAWISCNIFLGAFGVRLEEVPPGKVADFVENIAARPYEVDEIASWLTDHMA